MDQQQALAEGEIVQERQHVPSALSKPDGLTAAVFLGFSYFKDVERLHATMIGALLRENGINLSYGASDGGLMGALLRAHQNILHESMEDVMEGVGHHKRETESDMKFFSEKFPAVPFPRSTKSVVPEVRGVFPHTVLDRSVIHPMLKEGSTLELVTGLDLKAPMEERMSKIRSLADVVIILPGGPGTWFELFSTIGLLDLGSRTDFVNDMAPIANAKKLKGCKPIYILNTEHFFDNMLAFMHEKRQMKFVNVYDTPETLVAALVENWKNDFGRNADEKDLTHWSNGEAYMTTQHVA